MRRLIFILSILLFSVVMKAQIPFWGSYFQLSIDRTDTLYFKAEADSGFVITADTAVYFRSKGDSGHFIFDTIFFDNGVKLYGQNYNDSLTLYWDSTETKSKVREYINDSATRWEDSLAVHVGTLQAHADSIDSLRTDINNNITASDAGSQIHDTLQNVKNIVFDTTDLGTKSDTFTFDLSTHINYVTIDDTVAINYSNAESTTYTFIVEISGSNAKINWGTGWQSAGGTVSLTETAGKKILISAIYDIRNSKMIIQEIDDIQDIP